MWQATLGRAFRRAALQIRALPYGLALEERRSPAGTKESERRLRSPLPMELELWFLSHGERFLQPASWNTFLQTHYQPVLTVEEAMRGVEPVVIHRLLVAGQHDAAIERARSALAQTTDPRSRGPLLLALATGLIRRSGGTDWADAEALLTDFLAKPPPVLDLHDHLTLVRAKLRLAYCQFMRHIRGQEDTERVRRSVDVVRALLADAATVAHDLSLADRGQLTNLEGLLLKWEAQVETDPAMREERFGQADRHLRRTLTIWQGAQDGYLLGSLLYNLGELQFAWHRIDLGRATETQIREALVWYEASIRLGEWLGGQFDLFLDYARAVECIARLLPLYAVSGKGADVRELLARGEEYLAVARKCPPESWQWKLVTRVETAFRNIASDLAG